MAFELDVYLRRIGLSEKPTDFSGLASLQRAQMTSIAFENIDVLLGAVPDVGDEAVWKKLVHDRRGGYCFELNGLFRQALQALAVPSTAVLGRVRLGDPAGGARTHLAHVVALEGVEWLFDAGFGGQAPAGPIRLDTEEPQAIAGGLYRIRMDAAAGEAVLERHQSGGWFSLYGFDRVPVRPLDIVASNVVCARWSQSPFPVNLMAAITTEDGYIGLFNTGFTRRSGDLTTTRTIATAEELAEVLVQDLRLVEAAELAPRVWSRLPEPPAPS